MACRLTPSRPIEGFDRLCAAVHRNCLVSDARHAGNFTLCTYLMKMREFYRWEMGYDFTEVMPKDEVGQWLAEREQAWDELGESDYAAIPVRGRELPPFESAAINDHLLPDGLVYSGGLGHHSRTHFFLGELEREDEIQGHKVLISGREFARDLGSPPAMTQAGIIYVRRESLRRLLWEKIESWRWNRPRNAMARALACYPFGEDDAAALDTMTDSELGYAVLHEIGEALAGDLLGEDWESMLAHCAGTRGELYIRAVRDHLADTLSTLPALIESAEPANLHYYVGNLANARKELVPSLIRDYEHWCGSGDLQPLADLLPQAREHWLGLARETLAAYRTGGDGPGLAGLIESRPL